MNKLSLPLIFETTGYCPRILFCIELLNSNLKYRVSHDPSFLQTLLEELYYDKGAREKNYNECKSFVKIQLSQNPFIYYFKNPSKQCTRYNILTAEKTEWTCNAEENFGRAGAWCWVPQRQMVLYTGGHLSADMARAMFINDEQEYPQYIPDMHVARRGHGLQLYKDRVYCFAGNGPKNNVEFFNLLTNEWTETTPMITARSWPGTCVYRGMIYLAGFGSAYAEVLNPMEDTWTQLPFEFQNTGSATTDYSIFLNNSDRLVMLRGKYIHELDVQKNEKVDHDHGNSTEKWSYFPPTIIYNKVYYVSYKDEFMIVDLKDKSVETEQKFWST